MRQLASSQLGVYRLQNRELIGHYRRETAAIQGYRGRQLLELLQNADDAGSLGQDVSLLIEVRDGRLVVANTGEPFSSRGVESLVISDCSPKQFDRNRFIGCKGLGFKSVLTWTDAPLVVSSNLRLAFSHAHALARIQELAAEVPGIQEAVDDVKRADGEPPVPIMRFPFVPESDHADVLLAREYQNLGFTTVIVLPLRSASERGVPEEELAEQMASLATESLLFSRHLTQVVLKGSASRSWEILREVCDPSRTRVIIDAHGAQSLWTVYSKSGVLPAGPHGTEVEAAREYQLGVAVPEVPHAAPDRTLCVFFPTQDALPLPLAIHATLELSDDRNHLHNTRKNQAVLAALAEHIADVLVNEASKADPLRALTLLQGLESAGKALADLGFVEALLQSAREKAIFPRIDGSLGPASGSRRTTHDAWRPLVSAKHFPEVLDVKSDDKLAELLKRFKIEWYEQNELLDRLVAQAREMTPTDLGKLVGRLLTNERLGTFPLASLLLDRAGTLGGEAACFFNPVAALPPVPGWVAGICFLHPDFQSGLQAGASNATLRGLAGLFERRDTPIEEYRLETVLRALVHGVHEGDAATQLPRARETLAWLYAATNGSIPPSSQVKVPVLDTAGQLRPPEECYFNAHYPGGALVANLYTGLAGVAFVGPPGELGLADKPLASAYEFLKQLGVGAEPRPKPFAHAGDFARRVLEQQDYPSTVRGVRCESSAEALALCKTCTVTGVQVPDRWTEMLCTADASTLVAYFLTVGGHWVNQDVDVGARFAAMIDTERKLWNDPAVSIPNLVVQQLRATAWVPCDDGQKHRPAEIVLSGTGSRVLQGIYFRPSLRYDDPEVQRAGGRQAVAGFLMRLGAIASLEAIDADALYELLLRLPAQDPTGQHAAGIYRTLIEAGVQPEEGPARRRFIQDGKVWSEHEGVGQYLPVREVRYNANITIPDQVERFLKLAVLPRRKGTKTVEQLLGVQALSQDEVQLAVDDAGTKFDPRSEDANAHFRAALPYIYALRLARTLDTEDKERRLLDRAELRVCGCVRVVASLPGQSPRSIDISEPGDSILVKGVLYLIGQFDAKAASLIRFWQTVANLVAELLGTDFAHESSNVLRCRSTIEMEEVIHGALGDVAEERLQQAKTRLGSEDEPEAEQDLPVPPPAEPGRGSDEPEQGGTEATPDDTEPAAEPVPANPGFAPIQGPLPRPPVKRRLVITRAQVATPGKARLQAGEEDTFRVVEAFESLATPARFPIRVSHLRGAEAYGCDILSLATQAALDRALSERVIAESDILRFIEVKGRSARTGDVELTDNEFRKAQEEGDRYFLYRVFRDPQDRDHFEVAVLADPVNSEAVRQVTRFDLSEGTGAEWFALENRVQGEESQAADGLK